MANAREAMKAKLHQRVQTSYEKREDSGQFKNIFKEEYSQKVWKCGEGEHLIDIIPYPAGNYDPEAKPGDPTYVLILWVHYAIGVNQDAYVCLARNYNKPCPICEYREEIRRHEDFNEDLVKELTPKRRSIYNVVVYDTDKETAKGVQIFDSAHWCMEKHLAALAKIPERGASRAVVPYIYFPDPDEGKTVAFTRKGTKRNTEFLGHKFLDRDYAIPDEYLEAAFQLDECIIVCEYEEIQLAFMGGADDSAPVEEAPAPTAPPVAETPAIRARRPLPNPIPAPTPAPAAPVNPSPRTRATAPPPAATTETGEECPAGGTFGVDAEQLEACPTCPLWDACSAEADKIAADLSSKSNPPVRPAAAGAPRPTPRPAVPAAARPAPAAPAAPATPGPRRMTPRR